MLATLRAILIADPMIILSTIFFGSISLLVSFFDHDGRVQIRVARAWGRALLWFSGVKVEVRGLERIDPHASYVFASNHVSYMDTPSVLANIPVQFRFMAKKELFQIPFLGTHLARAGHIPVPRDDPRAAVRSMTEAGRIIRERGISVLVFPEGGRCEPGGGLQPFKEGGAYIAIKAGVPIVPMSLEGTGAILPRCSALVKPGNVILRIGDPIPTANLTLPERGRLTEEIRTRICEQLGVPSEASQK